MTEYRKMKKSDFAPVYFKKLIKDPENTQLLSFAFSWAKTPEGHDFWSDYERGNRPIDAEYYAALKLIEMQFNRLKENAQ
jgi:hypothetical protein